MIVPDSDDARQRQVQAYFDVYIRVEDAVRAGVFEELRRDPALAALVDAAAEDEAGLAQQRHLLERAIRGDWHPYLERLRETGRTYAQMGLEFGTWFRIMHLFRIRMLPHMVESYRDEPEQLTAAICGSGIVNDQALQTIAEAYLDARERTIAKQQAAITELSTPVLRIRDGLLLMPIVGVIDTGRSRQLTEALLHRIRDDRAKVVVLDITGVPEVDSEVANRLIQAAEATRLMGATPILTGISAGVAQTLVAIGVDLKGLLTLGDLQRGIQQAEALLDVRLVEYDQAMVDHRPTSP